MGAKTQELAWENPNPIQNATVTTIVTWKPDSFSVNVFGNFELNMWYQRETTPGFPVLKNYPPVLLAGRRKALDSGVIFTPTLDDVTVDVVQQGSVQLTWEFWSNNTAMDPNKIVREAFTKGFVIVDPGNVVSSSSASLPTLASSSGVTLPSSSTTAPAPSATTTTAVPITTPPPVASQTPHQGIIIGLSVGFGVLLGASVIAFMIWFLKRRKRRINAEQQPRNSHPEQELRPLQPPGDKRSHEQASLADSRTWDTPPPSFAPKSHPVEVEARDPRAQNGPAELS